MHSGLAGKLQTESESSGLRLGRHHLLLPACPCVCASEGNASPDALQIQTSTAFHYALPKGSVLYLLPVHVLAM